jgi:hypothetical protein
MHTKEICGFAIAKRAQDFADLQFADGKRKYARPFLQNTQLQYDGVEEIYSVVHTLRAGALLLYCNCIQAYVYCTISTVHVLNICCTPEAWGHATIPAPFSPFLPLPAVRRVRQ